MSSTSRMIAEAEAAANGIIRQVVRLPRNIISSIVNQGRDMIQRSHHYHSSPVWNPHEQPFMTNPAGLQAVSDEWAFLAAFQQQFGIAHPFFYACRFSAAMQIARDEHRLMFMYLHSPEHPFTPSFCMETLCSDLIIQFLDANFVCWGGFAGRGDGLHMAMALRASTFPFCAIIAPAAGDNLALLQKMEGPISAAELVEILQSTMEEDGTAFTRNRANDEEKRQADQKLREEQDAAHLAALCIDQENEQLKKNSSRQDRVPEMERSHKSSNASTKAKPDDETSNKADNNATEVTQILIRFPNGDRREHTFLSTETIQAIFAYIDSMPGVGHYRLISNFPRKVYNADQTGTSLKEAGLHPKASLFLEPL